MNRTGVMLFGFLSALVGQECVWYRSRENCRRDKRPKEERLSPRLSLSSFRAGELNVRQRGGK